MNAFEKNLAIARGESLAASLLAATALQATLSIMPNRQDLLARINQIGRVCLVLVVNPSSIIADCFHRALKRLAGVHQRFFLLAVSIMLERAQEFFLRTCKVFATQHDQSWDNGLRVHEVRIHSQKFAFRELISHSMLFESGVQLTNSAVRNFPVFSA